MNLPDRHESREVLAEAHRREGVTSGPERAAQAADTSEPEADSDDGVVFLNPDQAWAFFDELVRARLGISGEEFVRRWDAGEYDAIADDPEHPHIMDLAMLRPLDRQNGR